VAGSSARRSAEIAVEEGVMLVVGLELGAIK
jgi:hypothetical protein